MKGFTQLVAQLVDFYGRCPFIVQPQRICVSSLDTGHSWEKTLYCVV